MSVSSYLGSGLFPTRATLEESLGESGIVLLSLSSGWIDSLEVLDSGMIGSWGDSVKVFFKSESSADANSASTVSQLLGRSHRLTSNYISFDGDDSIRV
jgi:hypothetical protein